MFEKIKRDFLFLNMGIISILVFMVCASVYTAMYFNMLSIIDTNITHIEEEYTSKITLSLVNKANANVVSNIDKFYFVEDVGVRYSTNFSNFSDIEDYELRTSLTKICMAQNANKSIVSYEDKFYSYLKMPLENGGTRLIVLDVTDNMQIMHELAITMVLIGIFALFIIFLISNFFTNKSMASLSEAFLKQKNFISDASHELKTPLAVIKTNLDVILRADNLSDDDKKWLLYAKDEVNQMSAMINEFLYITKMDDKNHNITYTKVDLSSIVRGVLLSMEAVAFEKNIVIEDNITEDVFVKGAEEEIKRLVKILVDNAIKYANVGGDIFVTLTKEGNNACLVVKNTGTVIDPKDSKVIFERFYRANKERERSSQSYGLGLSIAKSTCDKHGFTIKAYPKDKMTCFKVTAKIFNPKAEGKILNKSIEK